MVYVFCEHTSPRIHYIFKCMFGVWLNYEGPIQIGNDREQFLNFDGLRINYSNEVIEGALHIPYSHFFNEDFLKSDPILGKGISGITLFPLDGSFDFSFDLPAAVFYLITRMEEYSQPEKDIHGRFMFTQSLAFRNNFLSIPVVDKWLQEFRGKVLGHFSGFPHERLAFRFLTTIDVDNGYQFRGKDFKRQIGGGLKDLLEGRPEELLFRLNVFLGNLPDPFDRYDWVAKQCEPLGLRPLYFILASERTKYDHALSPYSPRWPELLNKIKASGDVGIHPSYFSVEKPGGIAREMKFIANVTGDLPTRCRMHFLRFSLPHTYRNLIEFGIKHEYSMGYSDAVGFRAGTGESYPWYDLEREEETPLWVHPFCCMESVYRYKWKTNPVDAFKDMEQLAFELKAVGGKFTSVWHDKSLSRAGVGKRWSKIYVNHLLWAK
jgi:hypothetical protein